MSARLCRDRQPEVTAKGVWQIIMQFRISICMALAALSGCAIQSPDVEESMDEATVGSPADTSVADLSSLPVAIERAPDACEQLLTSLDDTQPLLTNLENSLLAQSQQLEAALARLNEPPRRPSASECPAAPAPIGNKEIIGAIEWLYMDPPGRHFRARVDSGAETSSLSASEIGEFERDGEDWIRFNFQDDDTDEAVHFELPIKRTVLIRQVSSAEPERRFVVEIDIRLGDQLQRTEFTLTDRSRMTYPVLIGRAFLMDLYVVDVSRSYTHKRYDAGD
jgi:hypothetical protein